MLKSVAFLFVAGVLLLAGCDKGSRITRADAPANLVEWGVVELSSSTPKYLSLGGGKQCAVTAQPLGNGQLQIDLATKDSAIGGNTSRGTAVAVPVETTQTQRMTVPAGVEIIVEVFQRPVRFTPKFKAGS